MKTDLPASRAPLGEESSNGGSTKSDVYPTLRGAIHADRILTGSRGWFSSVVTEEGSGVRFFESDGALWAELGADKIKVTGITPPALRNQKHGTELCPELRAAFLLEVVPLLILPAKGVFLQQVQTCACLGSQPGENSKPNGNIVKVVQETPLVVSVEGMALVSTGRMIIGRPSKIFLEWSDCGSLGVVSDPHRRQRQIPLAKLLRYSYKPLGMLEALSEEM